MWLNDLFWGIRNTFVGKYQFLVIDDHLWGPSVHVDKSFKKIQAWVRPPPPSWQCLYFGNFWSGNPSLMAASIVNASGMFEVIQDAVEALECYCGTLNATICRGPSRQHWWQLHFFYVPCSLWLTKFEILEFVQWTISPPWKWPACHKTQMFYHFPPAINVICLRSILAPVGHLYSHDTYKYIYKILWTWLGGLLDKDLDWEWIFWRRARFPTFFDSFCLRQQLAFQFCWISYPLASACQSPLKSRYDICQFPLYEWKFCLPFCLFVCPS